MLRPYCCLMPFSSNVLNDLNYWNDWNSAESL